MAPCVRPRLVEIQANRALRRRPAKRVCSGKRLEAAARLLTVLGNGRRLLTVMHLMEGERTVTGLRSRVGVSRSSVSQHLAILVEHGIVESRTKGARAILFLQIGGRQGSHRGP